MKYCFVVANISITTISAKKKPKKMYVSSQKSCFLGFFKPKMLQIWTFSLILWH